MWYQNNVVPKYCERVTLLFLKRVTLFFWRFGENVLIYNFTLLFLLIKVKSVQESKAVTNNVCKASCIYRHRSS